MIRVHYIYREPRFDVKAFRERWGLTQLQLSKKTGFAIETISKWENNVTLPNKTSVKVLKALERKLIRRKKRLEREKRYAANTIASQDCR